MRSFGLCRLNAGIRTLMPVIAVDMDKIFLKIPIAKVCTLRPAALDYAVHKTGVRTRAAAWSINRYFHWVRYHGLGIWDAFDARVQQATVSTRSPRAAQRIRTAKSAARSHSEFTRRIRERVRPSQIARVRKGLFGFQ
jgi:hypothetical protein